jgi:hypothetical protein
MALIFLLLFQYLGTLAAPAYLPHSIPQDSYNAISVTCKNLQNTNIDGQF